ncbi:MAG: hypothetical protein K0U69_03425, partial [Actinomycetia bacterium]|nr:hypothetical protein [Actinomycetes bacterium]MCH9759574.1 hypothetical protein [Actinomycetes bacterium]
KSETNKKHQNWHFPKNSHTPKREKEAQPKKQQTKTTKHTIEFSNNTPRFQATLPLYFIVSRQSSPGHFV